MADAVAWFITGIGFGAVVINFLWDRQFGKMRHLHEEYRITANEYESTLRKRIAILALECNVTRAKYGLPLHEIGGDDAEPSRDEEPN